MSEKKELSDMAKRLTKLVKDTDKLVQTIQKDVAKTRELIEEIKKLKGG